MLIDNKRNIGSFIGGNTLERIVLSIVYYTELVKGDVEAKERMKSNTDNNRHAKAALLNLFDQLHPFKKQFSAIHPHHDKWSYYRKLKLGDNDVGCIL